jgi:small GTP-binding protein
MAQNNRNLPYIKIVLIGDQGVGKTAILDSFEYKNITKTYNPTIGADFMKKKLELEDGSLCSLQLWDTAGKIDFSLCVLHFTEVLTAALSYMMLSMSKATNISPTGVTLSLTQYRSTVYNL